MTAMPSGDVTPILDVRNLTKSFGPIDVLRDVSFTVARGEVLVVLGPSGSGKSTMLRCINHLEEYEAGEIRIDGAPVGYHVDRSGRRRPHSEAQRSRLRTQVGMVFQSFNLFPHRTALGNVMAGPLHVRGMARGAAAALSRDLLAKVGLADRADAYPARLSGGQQQRVAIARALAMQPSIMLFDEVTSALDPELVAEVLRVILELAREGMTMVIVTHEIPFARDVAHRVIFMDAGRIVEMGPSERMLTDPATDRLRLFLRRYRGDYLAGSADDARF